MKSNGKTQLLAATLVSALAIAGCAKQGSAQQQAPASESRFDALANAPFSENRPTRESAQTLRDELLFQRATQTYLWALPLLNSLGMQVGYENVFGKGYFVILRFYGPTENAINKSWKPGDVEPVK